ncbi:MAG: hypothetical protein RL038_24, partial [Actinomycetota bacterium]
GEIANLVLFDPKAKYTVDRMQTESKSTNNPYHGHELSGQVNLTVLRGQITFQGGDA